MEMMITKDCQAHLQRNKINEEEEDLISLLPDCLLIDIISRLPSTKQAIRTGALSKRWQHLWPYVSNLIFNDYYPIEKYVSLVDKTLTQCRQSNLTKFQIRGSYDAQFESQVKNWILYAVSCNVQDLELKLPRFVPDDFIYVNSCFTHLKLECVLNTTGPISWSNLKSLSISWVDHLSEDSIQNILSGCPLLETLELRRCLGFGRIDITSKSVKNLVFFGYMNMEEWADSEDIIEINAPYITTLTITGSLWLANILLLDVSCLVNAHLDYKKDGHYEPTREVSHEETLNGLMRGLRHVKELTLGLHCVKVLFRLEAKGLIFPWNLNIVDATSPISFDTDSESQELSDRSDSDSNESGDSDGIVEQVLGTNRGHNHGWGKSVGVASTTSAQSQEPIYTQNQVDAMFEAQNNMIATQQNQVHAMIEAQNKIIATQHRMIEAQSSQFSTLVRALTESGFSIPASIVPEHVNEDNEEKVGEDKNAK